MLRKEREGMDTRGWLLLIAILLYLLTILMNLRELVTNKRHEKKLTELIQEEERKKYHD